jgi:hypothetical protein
VHVTFRTLRQLSVIAIVFNVAFAFTAASWLAWRISTFASVQPPWPWWRDFDIIASASSAAVSAFTLCVLWMFFRKTRRGPELEALQARGRQEIRDLEKEVQQAELRKRLRDLTTPQ